MQRIYDLDAEKCKEIDETLFKRSKDAIEYMLKYACNTRIQFLPKIWTQSSLKLSKWCRYGTIGDIPEYQRGVSFEDVAEYDSRVAVVAGDLFGLMLVTPPLHTWFKVYHGYRGRESAIKDLHVGSEIDIFYHRPHATTYKLDLIYDKYTQCKSTVSSDKPVDCDKTHSSGKQHQQQTLVKDRPSQRILFVLLLPPGTRGVRFDNEYCEYVIGPGMKYHVNDIKTDELGTKIYTCTGVLTGGVQNMMTAHRLRHYLSEAITGSAIFTVVSDPSVPITFSCPREATRIVDKLVKELDDKSMSVTDISSWKYQANFTCDAFRSTQYLDELRLQKSHYQQPSTECHCGVDWICRKREIQALLCKTDGVTSAELLSLALAYSVTAPFRTSSMYAELSAIELLTRFVFYRPTNEWMAVCLHCKDFCDDALGLAKLRVGETIVPRDNGPHDVYDISASFIEHEAQCHRDTQSLTSDRFTKYHTNDPENAVVDGTIVIALLPPGSRMLCITNSDIKSAKRYDYDEHFAYEDADFAGCELCSQVCDQTGYAVAPGMQYIVVKQHTVVRVPDDIDSATPTDTSTVPVSLSTTISGRKHIQKFVFCIGMRTGTFQNIKYNVRENGETDDSLSTSEHQKLRLHDEKMAMLYNVLHSQLNQPRAKLFYEEISKRLTTGLKSY